MDCNFKQNGNLDKINAMIKSQKIQKTKTKLYDDSKIPRDYDERINQVIGYKLQKSTLRILRKCVMELASARVNYMRGGSNYSISRKIFNIENEIMDEIRDINKRS